MKKFINKFIQYQGYTKKWSMYADYASILFGSILVYQKWMDDRMSGVVIWSLFTILALFRLIYNHGKFVPENGANEKDGNS